MVSSWVFWWILNSINRQSTYVSSLRSNLQGFQKSQNFHFMFFFSLPLLPNLEPWLGFEAMSLNFCVWAWWLDENLVLIYIETFPDLYRLSLELAISKLKLKSDNISLKPLNYSLLCIGNYFCWKTNAKRSNKPLLTLDIVFSSKLWATCLALAIFCTLTHCLNFLLRRIFAFFLLNFAPFSKKNSSLKDFCKENQNMSKISWERIKFAKKLWMNEFPGRWKWENITD